MLAYTTLITCDIGSHAWHSETRTEKCGNILLLHVFIKKHPPPPFLWLKKDSYYTQDCKVLTLKNNKIRTKYNHILEKTTGCVDDQILNFLSPNEFSFISHWRVDE